MAILSKGTTFATSQQVTSANLNSLVDSATFVTGSSGTTDDSTLEVNGSGRLQMKDLGTTAGKLASNSVTTAKIVDANVTAAKLSAGAISWGSDGTHTISANGTDPALKITQAGAGDLLYLEDESSDTSPFVVDADGNVSIGRSTGSTGSRLEVYSAATYAQLIKQHTNDNVGAGISLDKTRGTTASAVTIVQDDDTLGAVYFRGYDGTDLASGAVIAGIVDGSPGSNDMPSRLVFFTAPDGTGVPLPRMRVDNAGRVRIGSDADVESSAQLEVASTTRGFLPPKMTTTQRNAISTPTAGLVVYNTTTNKLNVYNGTSWEAVTSA